MSIEKRKRPRKSPSYAEKLKRDRAMGRIGKPWGAHPDIEPIGENPYIDPEYRAGLIAAFNPGRNPKP